MKVPDDIPGLGRKQDRPRPNTAALASAKLTPVEGFIFSLVDGGASYEQLCMVSGRGAEETLDVLRRFKRDGLIVVPGPAGTASAAPAAPTRRSSPAMPAVSQAATPAAPPRPAARGATPVASTPVAPPRRPLLELVDDGSAVDPKELESGPDMPADIKTRIVRLHRRLKDMEPFSLLALPRNADKDAIKRAYFSASKELHPDRFYGKDIGAFRDKLGDIFAALTQAFQKANGEGPAIKPGQR